MTPKQIVSWAGGVVAGIGVIIWLYATFLTKVEHEKWITSHKDWELEVLSSIHRDIGELKGDNKELKAGHNTILRKLDNIELRMMTKPNTGAIHTNDMKFQQSAAFGLIFTNLYE